MGKYSFNNVKKVLCTVLVAFSAVNYTEAREKKVTKFQLPELSYSLSALEPIISEQTMNLHYGKHLQTYINNLNALIVGTEFENADLDEIVKKSKGALFNNAAQVWNHRFYFDTFTPENEAVKSINGMFLSQINKTFGSFNEFKNEFVDAGISIFGSGWVWLVKDKNGELSIIKSSNADNPIVEGFTPLLAFDVWEHSYYLDYQNRRAEHLNELWKVVNWKKVSDRY